MPSYQPHGTGTYKFADSEIVKKRFELVVMGIIFISVLPMLIEIGREWLKSRSAPAEG